MSSPSSASSSSSSSDLIPNLPDDVALQCIARVPRSRHPHLLLVCKSWRSILSSSDFFSTRSLLNCMQHSLYLIVRVNCTLKWFVLNQNPRILAPLPPNPSPAIGSAFAAIGSKIFVLGGSVNDVASPTVQLGPRMRVGREFAAAGVVGRKIYVMGGCLVDTWAKSANWAEVFDPAAGRWAGVESPVEVREKWMHASAVVEEKIYAMADRGGVVFEPGTAEWGGVSTELDLGWRGRACVVDGVLYCYDYLGKIRGFDVKEGLWKELKGLEKGLPKFLCGATMANVGGNLVVLWEGKGNGKEMEISCAEIAIQKCSDGGLRGSIVWSDVILSVPIGSAIVHCLAVAV
ncbi:hypothetical protein AAG906_024163 [Vitis piasezkii]